MSKRLYLEGFTITPIVKAMDLDAGTVDVVGMNPVTIGHSEGVDWFGTVWPDNWKALQHDYEQSELSREAALANEAVAAKRAARPRKKAPAKKATARRR